MTLLGTPIKIDLTPGRRVLHVVTTERGERHFAYEVCGLARCYQTGAYRVVCLGASGLVLFPLDLFGRGFVDADGPDSEPAPPEPGKAAGVYHKGSGV